MNDSSRHFLMGIGLFGMVLGAALGIVAGDGLRHCADAYALARSEGAVYTSIAVHDMCASWGSLRLAAFGLVGMTALLTLGVMVAQARASRAARADAA